ncbi:MAG: hypothetical protein RLZ10_1348 [Bacteroidota bacterium]|jgi:hypothetical protein
MILIYVEEISERLLYTFDFIFKERRIEYRITNDKHFLENSSLPKFNYSNLEIDYVLYIRPSTLLFDENIGVYGIDKGNFEGEECLTINNKVDPIASIFYILTRMEEYNPMYVDQHGRFEAKNSVLNRFNWLEKVVCDRWAEAFIRYLLRNKIEIGLPKQIPFKMNPTFDIDETYAYKLKSPVRTWLATLKDLITGKKDRLIERQRVLIGKRTDPYDTFDYIKSIAERGFQVNLFWLLGDYAKFDKNVSHRNNKHRKLIQEMSKDITIGLHPSYKSNTYEFYLLNEKERLEAILRHNVENSRQHYLKVSIPKTYQILQSMGFKNDYTMGYAEAVGFRAGTARPFRWFDLSKNEMTPFVIHPFAYMDGTLREYMNLSVEEAKEKIEQLYYEIKEYGGHLSFIWHNSTIGQYGIYRGWKEVLEHTLNLESDQNSNRTTSI